MKHEKYWKCGSTKFLSLELATTWMLIGDCHANKKGVWEREEDILQSGLVGLFYSCPRILLRFSCSWLWSWMCIPPAITLYHRKHDWAEVSWLKLDITLDNPIIYGQFVETSNYRYEAYMAEESLGYYLCKVRSKKSFSCMITVIQILCKVSYVSWLNMRHSAFSYIYDLRN